MNLAVTLYSFYPFLPILNLEYVFPYLANQSNIPVVTRKLFVLKIFLINFKTLISRASKFLIN